MFLVVALLRFKMKNLKDTVFALFNNIKVEKFPDDSFVKDGKSKNLDFKYDWCFNEKKSVCNLFDRVEKHVNTDNIIQRVILTCTSVDKISIIDLEILANKLSQIECPDYDCSKSFSEVDKSDFMDKKNWKRSWFSLVKNKIHVHIYRNADLFAMHIVFLT